MTIEEKSRLLTKAIHSEAGVLHRLLDLTEHGVNNIQELLHGEPITDGARHNIMRVLLTLRHGLGEVIGAMDRLDSLAFITPPEEPDPNQADLDLGSAADPAHIGDLPDGPASKEALGTTGESTGPSDPPTPSKSNGGSKAPQGTPKKRGSGKPVN